MQLRIRPALAGATMAIGLALGAGAMAGAAPAAAGVSGLVRTLPGAHVARLLVRADSTGANAGLNFDGYAFGRLVFSVPQGWRVEIVFQNLAPLPHSLVVEPWNEPSDLRRPSAAFAGAQTPDSYRGTGAHREATITFVASKAGRYRLACAVPGHRDLGMWDTLVVFPRSRKATARVMTLGARR